MAGVDLNDFSEYEGGVVMPNTVFPKGEEALTNSDRLRLQSLTGQETDSRAPVDPAFWYGAVMPDMRQARADARARQSKGRAIRRTERDRYRETPRNNY